MDPPHRRRLGRRAPRCPRPLSCRHGQTGHHSNAVRVRPRGRARACARRKGYGRCEDEESPPSPAPPWQRQPSPRPHITAGERQRSRKSHPAPTCTPPRALRHARCSRRGAAGKGAGRGPPGKGRGAAGAAGRGLAGAPAKGRGSPTSGIAPAEPVLHKLRDEMRKTWCSGGKRMPPPQTRTTGVCRGRPQPS